MGKGNGERADNGKRKTRMEKEREGEIERDREGCRQACGRQSG